ncbi:Uncharacterized protein AXF42_Ash002328 [Apostasia shenzhenica]|uniref:At4g15545-like C-terminal domain-containing protein n=1 Tax=Apostasia shenzhenica TaxID=1088818 RepID=A0A2I0ANB7_9ASPA|nr:Uncharacterized protein AXF42_Ash002328 [Apostasia shenzhenica]
MAENGAAADIHLPDEILSIIPKDPYEQLDLARKITSLAIASRVSKLENEAGRMRQKIADKDQVISELKNRISELEVMFRETDARLRTVLEENIKLTKERDLLELSSKKMSKDLAKLEAFKRHLMQSLNDENVPQSETVDIGTCEQSVRKTAALKDVVSMGNIAPKSLSACTEVVNAIQEGQKSSISSYVTPKFTPSATPKVTSTGVSPRITSGATSPTKTLVEGYTSMSPWYPSSKQSSAASSPPRGRSLTGRPPRIDGKEFFRQARCRLSYEQFAAFLANIKELNAHKQSREETLKRAEEIFGSDNKDLYLSFHGLLNRN